MLQPGKGFITEVLGQKSEQKYQIKLEVIKVLALKRKEGMDSSLARGLDR